MCGFVGFYSKDIKDENVIKEMKSLLRAYNSNSSHTFEDIVDYHVRFERIRPLPSWNG